MITCSNTELFEIIKPHLSGLALGEVHRLIVHINKDTLEEFEEFVNESKNKTIKVIYDIHKDAFSQYLRKED